MRYAALAVRWAASTCHNSSSLSAAAGAAATAPVLCHLQLTRHTGQVKHFSEGPDLLPVPRRQQTAVTQQQKVQQSAVAAGSWTAVEDKDTGLTYWWNQQTGVTTPVGAPQPDAWVAVKDEATGGTYWWNKQSGDTTAVGEPLPGPSGRLAQRPAGGPLGPGLAPTTPTSKSGIVQALTYPLAMGFGVGLTFALIRMLVG